MKITNLENKYLIEDIGCFICTDVLDNGQCFRWSKDGDWWHGISGRRYARVKDAENGIILDCDDLDYWIHFLDLDYDYMKATNELSKDDALRELVLEMPGVRNINQDFFECMISFIISANNNVKRIKSIIDRICTRYGEDLGYGYSFPTPQSLAILQTQDMLDCGAGYRASYIIETARLYLEGFDYKALETMDLDDARKDLTQFKGVGIKVADCILLMSLSRRDAFPVDTWIRKVMIDIYQHDMKDNDIRKLALKRFGQNSGLANQYLFHYNRTKIK